LIVKGWAIKPEGIKEGRVYINGNFEGRTSVNIVRTDIGDKYPGHVGSKNSGYEFRIPLSKVPTGKIKLEVGIVGVNDKNATYSVEKFTTIEKPKSRIEIESIKTEGNNIIITGWAIGYSGVKELRMYTNGRYIGNADYGLKSNDIKDRYPDYIGSEKSRFQAIFDYSTMNTGVNKLEFGLVENGSNKASHSISYNYFCEKPTIVDLGFKFDFGLSGPSPNNPNKLVLHHAAGNSTASSVHDFHRFTNGWAGIGYHFYIHKDGTIYKGRDESWRGAHAAEVGPDDGNLNNDTNATSLGIAVQGNYHPTGPTPSNSMPKAQEDAVVKLGRHLVQKYGLTQIFKHGSPGIGHTSCPGDYYPFARIKARILDGFVYGIDSDNLDQVTD
ncbi:MAG: peptidoglycan recognition protein family protein, partial [Sarcina sp.]